MKSKTELEDLLMQYGNTMKSFQFHAPSTPEEHAEAIKSICYFKILRYILDDTDDGRDL
jgi:hypothetical protein